MQAEHHQGQGRGPGHDHAHHHAHGHGGSHPHPGSGSEGRRLLATVVLTGTIMLAEVAGGLFSGSLSLLADAGHMLTDFLALLVAFTARQLGARPADQRRTYGYRRLEILAALANGVALVVVSGSIVYKAIGRWLEPQAIDLSVMGGVAVLGLVANLVGLALLGGHRHDLNLRGAFLHLLGDALSSLGVAVTAVIIAFTGWTRLDSIISMIIAVVIVATSVALLREVVDVLLEAAPRGIDTEKVRTSMKAVAGVDEVHDLHVWSIASGMPALSAHVVVTDASSDTNAVRVAIQATLRREYHIDHSTLQVERRSPEPCGGCD